MKFRPAMLLAGLLLAGAAPPPGKPGMHLTFDEDFSHFAAAAGGTVSGRPAWQTSFKGGVRTLSNNHETEYYGDPGPTGPFHVSGGILSITASPKAGLPPGLTHQSGLITTQQSFSQLYGYFEIRAQLPRGNGLWPAFWLLPADGSWPPEIDVMEMLGGTPNVYYASIHARTAGSTYNNTGKISAPDLSAGFHTFGVSWRPSQINFYLDNVLVRETAAPAGMNQKMYLLANLATGGAQSWPGAIAPGASGTYRIAWIRAWQFNQ